LAGPQDNGLPGGAAAPPDDPRPVKPIAPDALDCCGGGCVPCIYDLYEQALERYEAALAAWLERHPEARGE
jgi:hypothetical protein